MPAIFVSDNEAQRVTTSDGVAWPAIGAWLRLAGEVGRRTKGAMDGVREVEELFPAAVSRSLWAGGLRRRQCTRGKKPNPKAVKKGSEDLSAGRD